MFSGEDMKKLAAPLALFVLMIAVGAGLIWFAERQLRDAKVKLAAATVERTQNRDRLSKIAEEEREVKEKLAVYRRLLDARVLGEEKRLEWADAVARIRKARELADVRYTVEPQRVMVSLPGKPGSVDFHASTMKLNMALLHEGDLLVFLDDLRGSGNAYYAIQRCIVSSLGAVGALTTLTPRIRAECNIDLITILDRGAKS